MLEWFLSSAVLAALMIALRYVLRGRVSLRLQYALWGLVLLRLLLPVSFGASRLSVQNLLPSREAVAAATPAPVSVTTGTAAPYTAAPYTAAGGLNVPKETKTEHTAAPAAEAPSKPLDTARLLRLAWAIGAALVCAWMLFVNLRFALRLRRTRKPLEADCPLPVYVSAAAETPCLFGFFRPAVYLSPQAAADPALNHILAHEVTHFRHGDQVWALLRGLSLALHWFDPLVWWAAALSRRDGELACDEGTLKRLGEGERASYGQTLIRMTAARKPDLFRTATTMTGGKGSIKERVKLIARKPKTAVLALIALVLIAAVGAACTFTGARTQGTEEWFIATAWPLAEKYAKGSGISIEKENAAVLTYASDTEAEVAFSEVEGDRCVVVYFKRWANGSWHTLDYNPVDQRDPDRWGRQVGLAAGVRGSNPQEVLDIALAYAQEQLDLVQEELGLYVTNARLTGIIPLADTDGLPEGWGLYRLEYRFRLDEPEQAVLPEGSRLEGDELTEWTDRGQPCLLVRWETGEITRTWTLVCATDTVEIENVYGTPEMLEKYGDAYTAAGTELYRAATEPCLTVRSGTETVSPYPAMRWAETWMGEGFLAADGVPVDAAIQGHREEIPALTRGEGVELRFREDARPASPVLRVYSQKLELLGTWWEEPEEALMSLSPGEYWCSVIVYTRGRYIPQAERSESHGWDCLFRLVVETEQNGDAYSTLIQNTALYALPEPELSPEEAALRLTEQFLEDMRTEDPGRTFRLLEYRDLTVKVMPTLELDREPSAIYGLGEEEIGEDLWIVEPSASFRYTGVISPIGPDEGEHWVDTLYQGSQIGFLLTRTPEGYTLRSRCRW